ncbi:VOC family protein [Pseudahrensia aquimaris]|uniref:VOC family protein n=1 Tax=Pseudahrensia aquimaris TaxID=744461 RepID=A0ABW3FGQ3_9HYPH
MGANISIVTLGVADLVRSTQFYTALGWADTTASQESVTFLQGHSIVLGLYSHAALAEDANTEVTPIGFRGVSLAVNLESEAAVDTWFDHAVLQGAHPQKRPEKVFWGGYSGYIADPNGHLWEVAYNPFFQGDPSTGQLKLEPKT